MFLFIVFTQVLLTTSIRLPGKAAKEPVSLSPETWPEEEYSRIEGLFLRKHPRPKPLAYSFGGGLVAGTSSVLAVHVGVDALKKGGNAMDACLATALAEAVLSAGSQVSFAGVTNILFYNQRTGATTNIDASWKIPNLRRREEMPTLETLGDSVLVPGFVSGVAEAAELTRFSLRTLLEPALYFADTGFKMPYTLSRRIKQFYNKHTLLRTPQGRNIFTNPVTRQPYKSADMFQQPQLAEFIRRLSGEGKNYFYQGNWAEKMTEVVKQHGGYMNMNDMTKYEAQLVEPTTTTYSGYQVTTTGADWYGVELKEKLNVMSLAKLWETKDSYLTNVTKFKTLAAVSRFSKFLSSYFESTPKAAKLIKEYFRLDMRRRGSMTSAEVMWDAVRDTEGLQYTNELMWELLTIRPERNRYDKYRHASSGIVAIDTDGNVCSMAHSANSRPWGTGLFVQGVALPHSGAVFQDIVIRRRPGARIPSGLQPIIIFKNISINESSPQRLVSKEVLPTRREQRSPASNAIEIEQSLREEPTPRAHRHHLVFVPQQGNTPTSAAHQNNRTTSNGVRTRIKTEIRRIEASKLKTKREKKGLLLMIRRQSQNKVRVTHHLKRVKSRDEHKISKERRQEGGHLNERAEEREPGQDVILRDQYPSIDTAIEQEINGREEQESRPEQQERRDNDREGFPEWEEEETEEEEETPVGREQENPSENEIDDVDDKELEIVSSDLKGPMWLQNYIREIILNNSRNLQLNIEIKNNKKKRHSNVKPVAALSVTGQSTPEAILQYITNILDSGMDAKQAVDVPMFYSSSPGSRGQDVRVERFAFDQGVVQAVRALEQKVTEIKYKFVKDIAGVGALLTVDRGKVYGCSHSDKEGFAEGL